MRNTPTSHLPASLRRSAAIGAAVALAAGTLALGTASTASATPASSGSSGSADAVVLKTGLDVSLANKKVDVPLSVALNEVHAPANKDKTLLTATLDGVDKGRPFSILRADVATAKATTDQTKSEGYANLTKATVHLPGLPALGLVQVDAVTSKATCAKGQAPTAGTNFVGDVTVLGKKVAIRAGGTTTVKVDGVGDVTLDLAKTVKTSTTAASTALQLTVHVNPGNLNVAEVTGGLTLVKASCATPGGGDGGTSGGSSSGGSSSGGSSSGGTSGGGDTAGSTAGADGGTKTQTGSGGDLAETGGSSTTPYLAGGAAVLLVAGAGAVYMSRRKKAGASADA
ncbi:SCO1860 family LAETG-anchored protein [Streptomyces odontomachi]|uniref:SCO1860 family LAETG-anchored protein n=1 Tax=Streptomyces odontomachi TaxID=2944940 RepID=UPI00210C7096|nr:SCO1860 family LAETG-anchored protein [Streptomyces sp. ODS25]